MEAVLTALTVSASRSQKQRCEPLHSPSGSIQVRNTRIMLKPMDRSDQPIDPGLLSRSRAASGPGTRAIQPHTLVLPRLLVVLLTLCLLTGCAAPIQYPRPVHGDKARAVTLEARYGYGQEGAAFRFTHPFVLTQAQWSHLLGLVQVQRRGWIVPIGTRDDGPGLAFRDDERAYLARQLSTAFAKARPDEWVLFYLSRAAESGLREMTSGGLFVEGGRLHVVIANYRLPTSMPHVAERVRRDPLRPMGDTFYSLVAGEHQEVRTHYDWHLSKPLLEHPMALVSDWEALLDEAGEGRERSRGGASPALEELGESETERRFRTLDRLRQQGLITDDEYARKRRELLDDL